MVKAVEAQGLITGFKVAPMAPTIALLQFADNSLIFCEASADQIRNVKAILFCFEAVSRLKINFLKTELIGIRFEDSALCQLADVLGCKVGTFPVKFLGLPLCLGATKKSDWNPVVGRKKMKLSTWKATHLSMGGRITLIKAALTNLPLYYFSIVKCPISVINKKKKLQRHFLC